MKKQEKIANKQPEKGKTTSNYIGKRNVIISVAVFIIILYLLYTIYLLILNKKLPQIVPHNPEVGGSNPPSATKGKPLILKTLRVLSIGGDSFFRTEIPQFSPLFWLFNDVQLLLAS